MFYVRDGSNSLQFIICTFVYQIYGYSWSVHRLVSLDHYQLDFFLPGYQTFSERPLRYKLNPWPLLPTPSPMVWILDFCSQNIRFLTLCGLYPCRTGLGPFLFGFIDLKSLSFLHHLQLYAIDLSRSMDPDVSKTRLRLYSGTVVKLTLYYSNISSGIDNIPLTWYPSVNPFLLPVNLKVFGRKILYKHHYIRLKIN